MTSSTMQAVATGWLLSRHLPLGPLHTNNVAWLFDKSAGCYAHRSGWISSDCSGLETWR
jgi:hypothetical protein